MTTRASGEASVKNRDIERLRAFAVLFVIVSHIAWIQGELNERLWLRLRPGTGVDLLFGLSGFVVSGAFERDLASFAGQSRGIALAAFYIKRAARILPTAYFVLLFWWAGWLWFNDSQAWAGPLTGDQVTGMLVANALFFSNYGMVYGAVQTQLGWYWSLCVEEHFYLLYPAFRLVTRTAQQRAKWLLALVVITVFGTRLLSDDPHVLQQLSHNRFDQLAMGVLLFLAWRQWTPTMTSLGNFVRTSGAAKRAAMAFALLALFAIATLPTAMVAGSAIGPSDQLFQMRIGLVVTGVLSFALVALASFDLDLLAFGWPRLGAVLFAIGTRSYALYMYHLPAKWIVQELSYRYPWLLTSTMPNGRAILVYVITLAILVELNYRLIEKPFIAWGRHRVSRLVDPSVAVARTWLSWRWASRIAVAGLVAILGWNVYGEWRTRADYQAAFEGKTSVGLRVPPLPQDAPTSDVVAYLRAHGADAVDLALPSLRYLPIDRPLVALNGASGRPTVLCRGERGWMSYVADAHGFNNPAARTSPALVLLGADAMAGVCVEANKSVSAQLRGEGLEVMNLALPGNGPLISLGALREYGLPARPKIVVWAFSEASEISNLSGELRSPILLKYLQPGFSQGLAGRVAETDALALEDFTTRWAAALPGQPVPPVTGAPEPMPRQPQLQWGHWFDFPALKRARSERALAAASQRPWAGLREVFAEPPPPVPADEPAIPVVSYLAEVLKRADADVRAAGGRLLFVYLPDRARFEPESGFGEGPRSQVLRVAAELKIPVADLTEVFRRSEDPRLLFATGGPYNASAMQLIAAGLLAASEPGH